MRTRGPSKEGPFPAVAHLKIKEKKVALEVLFSVVDGDSRQLGGAANDKLRPQALCGLREWQPSEAYSPPLQPCVAQLRVA
jgi:hypothetical protein